MKKLWFISCVLLLVGGCSERPQVTSYHVEDNQQELEKLEEFIADQEKISEGSAVFFDHELVVTIQVKPLSKFSKEKITKSFEKEVKSLFPDHKVFVSSDLKISWELKKIIEEQPEKDKVKKDLDKLQALSKEAT
ncbi:hypothetical protein [Paenisporosarcina indica]|uniref:hypothetical protein n=1 Tax=Paenisporosarcina indica TaxID=650093 RepID=UPI0009501B33|nr:hypothetical protein [Paenisporosarcina indica]